MANLASVCFATVISFYGLGVIQGQITEPCIDQIDSCSCKTKSGYINLHPLDGVAAYGQARFRSVSDDTGDNFYYYNPCSAFSMQPSCQGVSGCQMNSDGATYCLGSQNTAKFVTSDTDKMNMIQYTYKSTDGANRILEVHLVCDYIQGKLQFSQEDPALTYTMILTTKYACADFAPNPFNNTTTPAMTAQTQGTTSISPADCDCDDKSDITWILVTVVVSTFCLCILMLVAAVLVVVIRKYSGSGSTSTSKETSNNSQYRKL